MTMELLEGETTMEFYERALVERGPEIRARLGGMDDDGRHVFVATWPRSNGVDLIVWKTFEGLVGCIARNEAGDGPPIEAHWVLLH